MKKYGLTLAVLFALAALLVLLGSYSYDAKPEVSKASRQITPSDSTTIMLEKVEVIAERPEKPDKTAVKAKSNEINLGEIVVTAPRPQPIQKEITVYGKRPNKNAKPVVSTSKPVAGGPDRNRPGSSFYNGADRPDGMMGRGNLLKPDFTLREKN